MAAGEFTRVCVVCGVVLAASTRANASRYCGSACKVKARRARMRAAGTPIRKPRSFKHATCEECGGSFQSYPNGKSLSGWTIYCSLDCRWAQSRRAAIAASAVADEVVALQRIARYKPRTLLIRVECSCGVEFITRRNGGLHKKRCDGCLYETKRRNARAAKSARRSKERGARADRIDPIRVFERDGWRCHLCGCKTPARLRGSIEPTAPELDHIITLADGGSHTWGNVACACRACNQKKGAKSLGQLGLGLAA